MTIVVPLTGQTIREALDFSLQQYPKPGKAFLHVSGLRVAFAVVQPPAAACSRSPPRASPSPPTGPTASR